MVDKLIEALGIFVANCPHVVSTRDLLTKVRIELARSYILDLYYRESTGQYSYSLILNDQRVPGWDNARHHPGLLNAPHHYHREDGTVESSPMIGDPAQDIQIVAGRINALLAKQVNG